MGLIYMDILSIFEVEIMIHINKKILTVCVGMFWALLPVMAQDVNTTADSNLNSDGIVSESEEENNKFGLNDQVDLGFIKRDKKGVVGAASFVNPSEILKYDQSQYVPDAISGRITGLQGGTSIRAMGNALVVIDGIPGRSMDLITMEEVEQITVLKDANAVALYGAMARNGVIVITTKRGVVGKNKMSVVVNAGMRDPVIMPKYLGSADYMEYYNEASLNDGTAAENLPYSQELIDATRSGSNPYRYPDVDFGSDEYIKPLTYYVNALTNFRGGTENTKYFINLGYNYNESIYKLDNETGNNRFNVRANIDFKINDWIKSTLDVMGMVGASKNAHNNLLAANATFRPNMYSPVLPISMMDTQNEALMGIVDAASKYNGHILGVSQAFQGTTPYANAIAGGYRKDMTRISQVNNQIDFDLSGITEGLTARTYLSFDFYNQYGLSIDNQYATYQPTWAGDTIVSLTKFGQDQKDQEEDVNTNIFGVRYGFYGLINYEKQINDDHDINVSFLGFANQTEWKDLVQPLKFAHLGLNFSYAFKNKILADFSGAYSNSAKLAEGHRGAFSPTVGLAYVLTEESFIENVSWLNYLKLRGSYGLINSDLGINEYFLYDSEYARAGSWYGWADTYNEQSTVILKGENDDLENELRDDINLGFEAIMFDNLWVEANYFKTAYDKQITRLSTPYPDYYSSFRPYGNFNTDTYTGFEVGAAYMISAGKFGANIGARYLYTDSERTKVDEKYEDAYQYRQGTAVDAIWGLEDLGYYSESDFNDDGTLIESLPTPSWGSVQPGDIKYADQNNDEIVDSRDYVNIGRWVSPHNFSSDLTFTYGRLNLFVLMSGATGNDGVKSGSYFRVEGQDKYSEVVMGRWTPQTAGSATFPRLSTQDNQNNFSQTSTFWLYDQAYFAINRAQLTYELPQQFVDSFSVYAACSNVATFGPNADIRQLRVGTEPNYRYYTLGLRMKF
jgi:TonB-linked SusC/RagA family outer membrane protein